MEMTQLHPPVTTCALQRPMETDTRPFVPGGTPPRPVHSIGAKRSHRGRGTGGGPWRPRGICARRREPAHPPRWVGDDGAGQRGTTDESACTPGTDLGFAADVEKRWI